MRHLLLLLSSLSLYASTGASQSITIDTQGFSADQQLASLASSNAASAVTPVESLSQLDESMRTSEVVTLILFEDSREKAEESGSLSFLFMLAGSVWNTTGIDFAFVDNRMMRTLALNPPTRERGLWLFTSTHPRASGLRLPFEVSEGYGETEAVHVMFYILQVVQQSDCDESCSTGAEASPKDCVWRRNDGSHADPRKMAAKREAEAKAKIQRLEQELEKLKEEI